MILAAIFPAALACALFFGSLRQRPTTKAQREHVAATAREFRMLAGRSLLMLALFVLPLVTVAGIRLLGVRADEQPLELR